ncbi:HAD family hydrolase [Campylobacter coli]|uniref:HAD family hydrolase n=1 Tax=Campylobacter coli TaxID=195 RepID=UPI0014953E90|nr:HAD family hydrolase [Campylobacter coli]EFT7213105.1 HAD family hydrolase [Campylobacter coli]EHO8055327.1 HAD family hydrolase [Campylobacter coli]EIA3698679.1 HAD family hydrolase [Campylobacter coli]EIL2870940.1 HAD family hydrolase [Campylobacter coli]EIQ3507550.1 HAD family hydrolase [Campylobacter coli]
MNENIKAVIFDLDNTLYDENVYIAEVLDIFSKKYSLNFDKNKFIYNKDLRNKSNDIFSFWLNSINFYSKEYQEELFELYQNISCQLKLYNDAKILLDFLYKKGIKIGILTNGTVKAQKNKIKCLQGILQYNPIIFYARSLGKDFEKPHVRAFEGILNIIEVEKINVLFVGDNPYTDIYGAKNFGIRNILVKRERLDDEQINSDLVVKKLDEVMKLW